MTSYRKLAYVYDQLMEDAPYSAWLDYFDACRDHYGQKVRSIADLACGTGTFPVYMAAAGYEMEGIDLSGDMIQVAEQKAGVAGLDILFSQQDMRSFSLRRKPDAITMFCDSLNYVTALEDIEKVFKSVYRALGAGGLFVFDVHGLVKKEIYLEESPFVFDEEDISYIWETEAGERNLITHNLKIFLKEQDGRYTRFDETHRQRIYSPEWLNQLLVESGFRNIIPGSDFIFGEKYEDAERLMFSCQK